MRFHHQTPLPITHFVHLLNILLIYHHLILVLQALPSADSSHLRPVSSEAMGAIFADDKSETESKKKDEDASKDHRLQTVGTSELNEMFGDSNDGKDEGKGSPPPLTSKQEALTAYYDWLAMQDILSNHHRPSSELDDYYEDDVMDRKSYQPWLDSSRIKRQISMEDVQDYLRLMEMENEERNDDEGEYEEYPWRLPEPWIEFNPMKSYPLDRYGEDDDDDDDDDYDDEDDDDDDDDEEMGPYDMSKFRGVEEGWRRKRFPLKKRGGRELGEWWIKKRSKKLGSWGPPDEFKKKRNVFLGGPFAMRRWKWPEDDEDKKRKRSKRIFPPVKRQGEFGPRDIFGYNDEDEEEDEEEEEREEVGDNIKNELETLIRVLNAIDEEGKEMEYEKRLALKKRG